MIDDNTYRKYSNRFFKRNGMINGATTSKMKFRIPINRYSGQKVFTIAFKRDGFDFLSHSSRHFLLPNERNFYYHLKSWVISIWYFFTFHTFQVDCQAPEIDLLLAVHLHHLNLNVCHRFVWLSVSSRQKIKSKTNLLSVVDSVAIFYCQIPFYSLLFWLNTMSIWWLWVFKLNGKQFNSCNYLMRIFFDDCCGIYLWFPFW